jgi:hypothetical protein
MTAIAVIASGPSVCNLESSENTSDPVEVILPCKSRKGASVAGSAVCCLFSRSLPSQFRISKTKILISNLDMTLHVPQGKAAPVGGSASIGPTPRQAARRCPPSYSLSLRAARWARRPTRSGPWVGCDAESLRTTADADEDASYRHCASSW